MQKVLLTSIFALTLVACSKSGDTAAGGPVYVLSSGSPIVKPATPISYNEDDWSEFVNKETSRRLYVAKDSKSMILPSSVRLTSGTIAFACLYFVKSNFALQDDVLTLDRASMQVYFDGSSGNFQQFQEAVAGPNAYSSEEDFCFHRASMEEVIAGIADANEEHFDNTKVHTFNEKTIVFGVKDTSGNPWKPRSTFVRK